MLHHPYHHWKVVGKIMFSQKKQKVNDLFFPFLQFWRRTKCSRQIIKISPQKYVFGSPLIIFLKCQNVQIHIIFTLVVVLRIWLHGWLLNITRSRRMRVYFREFHSVYSNFRFRLLRYSSRWTFINYLNCIRVTNYVK